MRLTRIRGHYLWTPPLTARSVVVDAGAYLGEFSTEIIQRFGCRCHLIEADPALASALSVPGSASITNAALAATDGRTTFYNSANPEGGSILPVGTAIPAARLGELKVDTPTVVEVETISLPTLMRRIGVEQIDLLKLDIEGAEFDLIAATPESVWRRVGQITVEFHDFQQRFVGQQLFERCRDRLMALGFVCCLMSFRTHGDVLFLNQRSSSLHLFYRLWLQYGARWLAKLKSP